MTDTPKRIFGPANVSAGLQQLLYTCPPKTKTFIRDITFANPSSQSVTVLLSIGSSATVANRIYNQTVAANSIYSFRGLWILDEGETIYARQTTGAGVTFTQTESGAQPNDGTTATNVTVSFTANTLYIAACYSAHATSGAATHQTLVNTVGDTGSWTKIGQGTGVAAGTHGVTLSLWYYIPTTTSSGSTTTLTVSATQHNFQMYQYSVTGVALTTTDSSYATVPIVGSAFAGDAAAPASTALGYPVTITPSGGGVLFVAQGRANGAAATSSPPTGYTELNDSIATDAAGTVSQFNHTTFNTTTPPDTSGQSLQNTYSTSVTSARVGGVVELAPAANMTMMINAVEVTS